MKQAHRFNGRGQPFEGLTRMTKHGPVWTGNVRLVPEALDEPLRWKKPARVFVNSMSDLFHESVADDFLDRVFAVMALTPQHTYQVLTKRPARMLQYVESMRAVLGRQHELREQIEILQKRFSLQCIQAALAQQSVSGVSGALANVWLGVSVENQATADERIPLLLQTPAAVRFLSVEPLLERIDLKQWIDHCSYYCDHGEQYPEGHRPLRSLIDWVIIGGESGRGARPCNIEWIRSIVEQCKSVGLPCFVKQLGANPYFAAVGYDLPLARNRRDRKGGDPAEWPEDLRIREYPDD
jgi:protein gp37